MRPFSQACENNKQPILTILKSVFASCSSVLEIGSGTGQHAVHFAEHLPQLTWRPSDRNENLPGIQAWLDEYPGENMSALLELDVTQTHWPANFDAVYSANTAHIMPWEVATIMLNEVAERLPTDGLFVLYGPFKYQGQFTSQSNAAFDASLKSRDPRQGIRDFEAVNELLVTRGMGLIRDHALPANNQLVIWKKHSL